MFLLKNFCGDKRLIKCPRCNSIIYNKEWEENLHVCPYCNYHEKLT
ncbi:MAG: acetyl-CoA carboxylase carboxyl transferase subunit beta, partial [Candidatus Bathyarchaeota archaeon]|nr:acetyl-CoA carboxylase carboxyl transferase subunit beta [Candidatus Bathyarchaeota archaeon]